MRTSVSLICETFCVGTPSGLWSLDGSIQQNTTPGHSFTCTSNCHGSIRISYILSTTCYFDQFFVGGCQPRLFGYQLFLSNWSIINTNLNYLKEIDTSDKRAEEMVQGDNDDDEEEAGGADCADGDEGVETTNWNGGKEDYVLGCRNLTSDGQCNHKVIIKVSEKRLRASLNPPLTTKLHVMYLRTVIPATHSFCHSFIQSNNQSFHSPNVSTLPE